MEKSFSQLCAEGAALLPKLFKTWEQPRLFMQCGSGFEIAGLFDSAPQAIELNALPGMPQHRTPDQEHPRLFFGKACGLPVLATEGHRHLYEGLGMLPCILPVCLAHCLGIRDIILVDSGLSLNRDIKPGTWILLTDFINAHHCSPLDGNHHLLPDAFPDMTQALSQHLNSELINALDSVGIFPKLGVYMSRPGSQFCTVSEANMARMYGADILGQDLVMEIIMARALGCNVSAFALAAHTAPDNYAQPLTRATILDTCRFCSYDLMRGIRKALVCYFETAGVPL